MTIKERKEYNRKNKEWSRKIMDETKKNETRSNNRELKCKQKLEERKSDDADESSDEEDFENYWDDYEDAERDRVLLFNKFSSEELRKEAEEINKCMKDIKKNELKKVASPIPKSEQCQYEKIRGGNVKERMINMIESGLWT